MVNSFPYLDDYRGQFQLEYEDLLHIYNDLLSRYVSITLSDMELELSDAFELIETLMDEESTPADEIIDQFEKQNFEKTEPLVKSGQDLFI